MASNLTQATREWFDASWESAVAYGSPLLTRLVERKQVIPGGQYYERIYQNADLFSLAQVYGPNDGLNGGKKEIMGKPHWHVGYIQVPIEENVDEKIMNKPKTDAQLISIMQKYAPEAVRAIKLMLMHYMYGCAVDNEVDSLHTYPQGLISALMDGATYGNLSRTEGTADTWQAADFSNWDTAVALNKYNLDEWLDSCMEYNEDRGEYLVIMGATLWNRLKGIMEASNVYTPKANKAMQGFESMEYNGVEIAKDYLLDRMTYQGSTSNQGTHYLYHNGTQTINATALATGSTTAGLCGQNTTDDNGYTVGAGTSYVFVLDLRTWHLMYYRDPDLKNDGPFGVTDFFEQSQIEGGTEKKLARAKFKGNLICSMPNRNLMRANVS